VTALKATTASNVTKVSRRAIAVAALATGAALALSGCGAGQISQTAGQVPAVNGSAATVGNVALRDVRILLPQSEEYTNAKGGKSVVAFSAINEGSSKTDQLVSITTDLGQVKITPATPELVPGQTVVAASPEAAKAAQAGENSTPTSAPAQPTSSAATPTPEHSASPRQEGAGTPDQPADPNAHPILVEVTGLSKDIVPGLTYGVTFNFKNAGTVQVQVPVDAGPNTPRHEGATVAEHGGH
jgi:copper(I)-binding protein